MTSGRDVIFLIPTVAVTSAEPEDDQPYEYIGYLRYLANALMCDDGADYPESEDGHEGNKIDPGRTARGAPGIGVP
jgi:hypothetical protein